MSELAFQRKARRMDFYADDWIAGTVELTLEEEGAYIRICALIYSKCGPIPDNDRWLAGMCRVSSRKWRSIRKQLIAKGKITVADQMIHQARCEFELERFANRSKKQAENVAKRWRKRDENEAKVISNSSEYEAKPLINNKTVDTTVYTKGIPTHQPPTTNTNNILTVASLPERQFDDFWRAYPSREPHANPKKPAKAKFLAALKRRISAAEIIRGAENYAAYVAQESSSPKFTAQATTWLNQERWAEYQKAPKPAAGDGGWL